MTAATPASDLIFRLRRLADTTGIPPVKRRREVCNEAADALATVTAERDQAREALAIDNKLGAFETGKIIGAAEVRKELDQARQILADAPHGLSCESRPWFAGTCNCWKAGL